MGHISNIGFRFDEEAPEVFPEVAWLRCIRSRKRTYGFGVEN